MNITDEMLSAYLDGELTESEMTRIEDALLSDKELDARLARLQHANDAVHQAYAGIADEPVPQHLIDSLRAPEAHPLNNQSSSPSEDKVISFPGRPTAPVSVGNWATAMAATIALFVGYLAAVLVGATGTPGTQSGAIQLAGTVEPHTPLHHVFESVASSRQVVISEGQTIEPILSYVSTTGQVCREAAIDEKAQRMVLVACRQDGAWQIELAVRVPAQGNPESGTFQTASANQVKLLDTFLQSNMAGDALNTAEETDLIMNNWTPHTGS